MERRPKFRVKTVLSDRQKLFDIIKNSLIGRLIQGKIEFCGGDFLKKNVIIFFHFHKKTASEKRWTMTGRQRRARYGKSGMTGASLP